ncbi:MAG: ABC transporter permease subunit [Streptosporangiales bacterium]|nr:ABC transporter permease subunit [Streptosporangiales bacterium]
MTETATVPTPAPGTPATGAGRREGLLRAALRLRRTRAGLVLTALVLGVALLGPLLAPHSPTEFVAAPFSGPADGMPFGSDQLGRDVLSRFLHGGLTVLGLAAAATAIGVGFGALLGVVAGYRRGVLDEIVMRTGDVVLAFPQLVAALLFLSIIGPKLWLLVLVVGVSHVPRTARVVREATLKVVEQDFVKAAEAIGVRRAKIMAGELLPNVSSALAVELGLRLTYSIGLVAGLGFLGLGLQPPTADWGLMINENRIAVTVQAWAVALPVSAVALLTVGTNLITDGLARASIGIDRGVRS